MATALPLSKNNLGFYSELLNQVSNVSMKQAPAAEWKSIIASLSSKGVTVDEIIWSGVNDFLDLMDKKVLRSEIVDYLILNQTGLNEKVLKNSPTAKVFDVIEKRLGRKVVVETFDHEDDADEFVNRSDDKYELNVVSRIEDTYAKDPARYADYTLLGGSNYREVLLTLPHSAILESFRSDGKWRLRIKSTGEFRRDAKGTLIGFESNDGAIEAIRQLDEVGMSDISAGYKTRHWDQPNVLSHLRISDRLDDQGSRVLFVDEAQSDWAQNGRKKGFNTPRKGEVVPFGEKFCVQLADGTTNGFVFDTKKEADKNLLAEIANSIIPSAPFVDTTSKWLNLTLKRLFVIAAEGGYDKVAFISGEQSSNRYDLSKKLSLIEYALTDDQKYKLIIHDASDEIISVPSFLDKDSVISYVGKDIAEKIFNTASSKYQEVSGDGLKSIAPGMKSFYDKILPHALNSLLRKLGGEKAQTINFAKPDVQIIQDRKWFSVDGINDDGNPKVFSTRKDAQEAIDESSAISQNGFTMTQKMREKILAGMPLFSKQGRSKFVSSDASQVLQDISKLMRVDQMGEHLTVVQSVGDLPVGILRSVNPSSGTQGFVIKNHAYLVADNIATGKAKSVFLHEVGAHLGLERLLSKNQQSILVGQILKWAQRDDDSQECIIAKAAEKRVAEARTPASQVNLEWVAYFVEEAVDAGIKPTAMSSSKIGQWLNTVWSALKKGMNKLGLDPEKLTAKDVVDMAYGAARLKMGERPESKVDKLADANGNPLKLYHGTRSEFGIFNDETWFAVDPAHASSYATDGDDAFATGSKVLPVNLQMNNPLDLTGIELDNWFDPGELGSSFGLNTSHGMGWDIINNPKFSALAKEFGYDGIIANESHPTTGKDSLTFKTFYASQIKSAIGEMNVKSKQAQAKPNLVYHNSSTENRKSISRSGLIGSDKTSPGGDPVVFVSDAPTFQRGMDTYSIDASALNLEDDDTTDAPDGERWYAIYSDIPVGDLKLLGEKLEQTESPEFKAWFGDSKIVNEEGKPIVVYHGTYFDFSEFDGYEVTGWFSETPDLASERYASGESDDAGPNVMPVFLSIKNPKKLDFDMDDVGEGGSPIFESINKAEYASKLQAQGYDGMIVNENGRRTIAAFSASQIKSAIGNNGNFDASKSDIRYSVIEQITAMTLGVTPEVIEKFKGSKVVDAKGKPLMVFHGTPNDFSEFEIGRETENFFSFGKGITRRKAAFFSTDEKFANTFARKGGRTIKAYLSLKNPIDLSEGYSNEFYTKHMDMLSENNLLSMSPQDMWEMFDDGFPGSKEFIEAVKSDGYDGAKTVERSNSGELVDVYAAFDSSQIISVASNNFDANGTDHVTEQAATQADVEEAKFKNWFSESKIVDDDGKPLVMYHATEKDFSTFQKNHRGLYFVTPDPEWASAFLDNDGSSDLNEGANILPLFVRAVNPFDYENRQHVAVLAEKLSFNIHEIHEIEEGNWNRLEDKKTIRTIKELGFDGVYVFESEGKNLGVFSPEQLKSAMGNNGNFDATNDDIRYSFAGQKAATVVTQDLADAQTRLATGDAASAKIQSLDKVSIDEVSDGGLKFRVTQNGVYLDRFGSLQEAKAFIKNEHTRMRDLVKLVNKDSARAVREETGWFKGVDGFMRFEINDADAFLKGVGTFGEIVMKRFAALDKGADPITLGDILWHPSLFVAYPALAKMEIRFTDKGVSAKGQIGSDDIIRINQNLHSTEALSVLLHEVQHGIQHIEGFANGGSASMFDKKKAIALPLDVVSAAIDIQEFASKNGMTIQAVKDSPPKFLRDRGDGAWTLASIRDKNSLQAEYEFSKKTDDPMGSYMRLAGEVEARNVQTRQKFTDEERQLMPAYTTQDIPNKDVIIMFNGVEALSAPMPANAKIKADTKSTFKSWFDKSKAVDSNGVPAVFYHGSSDSITKLNADEVNEIDKKRLGAYFTANESFAATFGENVLPVHLSIQRPFDITGLTAKEVIERMPVSDRLKKELHSAFKGADYSQYGLLESAIRGHLRTELEKSGIDGIKYTEGYADAFIAFYPEQIKPAIPLVGFALVESMESNNEVLMGKKMEIHSNNEVLTAYHGSVSEFNKFDPLSSMDGGFYFTSDKCLATSFSKDEDGELGFIYEVSLDLKNPKTIDLNGNQQPTQDGMRLIFNAARTHGYDGVILHNVNEFNGMGTQYVAFDSSQIKVLSKTSGAELSEQIALDHIKSLHKQVNSAPPFSDLHLDLIHKLTDAVVDDAKNLLDTGHPPVYLSHGMTSVITPSAQQSGLFQVTRYNSTGAIGDSQYKSVEDAVKSDNLQYCNRLDSTLSSMHMDILMHAESEYQRNKAQCGVAFKRSNASATGVLTRQATQEIIDLIKARWSNAPEVVVIDSMDDPAVPQNLKAYDQIQKSLGATGEPEGFWHSGKVFIVAQAMSTPKHVTQTLFHESLGHYGLRGTFGNALDGILRQVALNRREDVAVKAKQYGLDMNVDKDRLRAAEEVLAEMAQTKPELTYVKQVIAVIRNFLRNAAPSVFGGMKMGNDEIIASYILPARRFVENNVRKTIEPTFNSDAACSEKTDIQKINKHKSVRSNTAEFEI